MIKKIRIVAVAVATFLIVIIVGFTIKDKLDANKNFKLTNTYYEKFISKLDTNPVLNINVDKFAKAVNEFNDPRQEYTGMVECDLSFAKHTNNNNNYIDKEDAVFIIKQCEDYANKLAAHFQTLGEPFNKIHASDLERHTTWQYYSNSKYSKFYQ